MPTKRTRVTRNRTQKTVNTLGFDEIMAFTGGWSPLGSRSEPWADDSEAQGREPWQSWRAFLADWRAVRDDWFRQDVPPGGIAADETFAEWLLNQYGPDGPPDMEPEQSEYPALIPEHPLVRQYRLERDTLNRLPGRG